MWLICLNFVNKFHIVFLSLDYQGVHILCHNDLPRDETFTLIETEVSAHLLIIYRYSTQDKIYTLVLITGYKIKSSCGTSGLMQ